jgi:hypothetical protein
MPKKPTFYINSTDAIIHNQTGLQVIGLHITGVREDGVRFKLGFKANPYGWGAIRRQAIANGTRWAVLANGKRIMLERMKGPHAWEIIPYSTIDNLMSYHSENQRH